jgi:uncharacterized protein with FMN-binding domain
MKKPGSGDRSKRVSNGLVALGSAAVLTVYTAGYARTRPAAARFALADDRRPAPPTTPAAAPELASAKPAATIAVPTSPAPRRAETQTARRTATTPRPVPPTAVAPVAATPAPAPELPPAPPPAADPISIVEPPNAPPKSQYKDGTYLGWGTSRHGDIQASVVIAGGRIESATIAQCLTRYSCSWIAALPPQVAARQSPEVDYVSGATQSTNAFYYAVVEALNKAK